MTRPSWLTTNVVRWSIVVAMLLVVVGVRVRRGIMTRRTTAMARVTHIARPEPASPEALALLAPLTEGSVVQEWTIRAITSSREGGLFITLVNAGRTIDVHVQLLDPSGPVPPVRVPPYVVYYNAHGALGPIGFSLAQAIGAAIRPHAHSPVPADLRRH